MTDQKPHQLSTHVKPLEAATRELAPMVSSGIMTVETQQQLAMVIGNINSLEAVSSPVGKRHFARTDLLMQVRMPTPVSAARACLAEVASVTDELRTGFHVYRTMFLEANLRKAKLKQAMKVADIMKDADDREIALAECQLEAARIDELNAEVHAGAQRMTRVIEKASTGAKKYNQLCIAHDKPEGFTDADFLQEEIATLHKSIWWHLATICTTATGVMSWDELGGQGDAEARLKMQSAQRFNAVIQDRQNIHMEVPEEALALMQSMQITEKEVRTTLGDLEEQRFNFNLFHNGSARQSFRGHFEGWLARTVGKFQKRVEEAVALDGLDRLHRIMKLLNPHVDDEGEDVGLTKRKRGSLLR